MLSQKKKLVKEGLFYAELNEFLRRRYSDVGYDSVEIRGLTNHQEIIIKSTKTKEILGEKGLTLRQSQKLVQKRFKLADGSVDFYAEKLDKRGLSARAQAQSIRFKLISGLAVRRACYGVLRFIKENGAKGVQIIVSGKLRGQRAKAMKFKDGYMISSGEAVNEYISEAVEHVPLRQGTIGVRVTIMRAPEGQELPDVIKIQTPPKEDEYLNQVGMGGVTPQQPHQGGYEDPAQYQQQQPPQPQETYGAPQETPGGYDQPQQFQQPQQY